MNFVGVYFIIGSPPSIGYEKRSAQADLEIYLKPPWSDFLIGDPSPRYPYYQKSNEIKRFRDNIVHKDGRHNLCTLCRHMNEQQPRRAAVF